MRCLTLFICLTLAPCIGHALEVFACEPEWAALIRELAGDEANVVVATSPLQDPHRLQARPSLIARVRQAELLVCTGADLEIGWLPLLLRRAGNARIQAGALGNFLAADHVRKIEIPAQLDRSQGDIHPQGNPHIHLHPRNIARVAEELANRLVKLDPTHAAAYEQRLQDFLGRWEAATIEWERRAEPLAGMRLVSHHRSFSYLADWLDLDIVATLEPKPGIPPSGAHLARLLEQLSPRPPVAIIRTPYSNEKPSLWLSERLNVPTRRLPYTVGGTEAATDLFGLFDATLVSLAEMSQ